MNQLTTPTTATAIEMLDTLTGGAFSAPTSSERCALVQQWLQTQPSTQHLSDVYKELSQRDKGAARALKDKLDDIKRVQTQEAIAQQWLQKGQLLLEQSKLNIADAMAWQRDAAKAYAPLSEEPLASLQAQLVARVQAIEDLQERAQVQREAALLIAQRIEALSTQSWQQAKTAWPLLRSDVTQWHTQVQALQQDPNCPSLDPKWPLALETARDQLQAVWHAFEEALALATAAADDPAAELPEVPIWAQELHAARAGTRTKETATIHIDPQALVQAKAEALTKVQDFIQKLEQSLSDGQGKVTVLAAQQLRLALKEYGQYLNAATQTAAQTALAAASQLEGWQRWRADQVRQELVTQAQALQTKPLGGRKQQEALRQLREQWKTCDQGGIPNHALWKPFDHACNEAYKVVESWLEQLKTQTETIKKVRRALIDQVLAWSTKYAENTDWKFHLHQLNQFSQSWRAAGHLGEKAFAQLEQDWKLALRQAEAPLKAARADSLSKRQAMIEEAKVLGEQNTLNIAAVKSLQQRWQTEAHTTPLERRQEQKLWDAFRSPIDAAFERKSTQREEAAANLSTYDQQVLQAAQALEQASASADANAIRAALQALEQAASGMPAHPNSAEKHHATIEKSDDAAPKNIADCDNSTENVEPTEPAQTATRCVKPLVAMRGDDRPGMKKSDPMPAGRAGRPAYKAGHKPTHRSENEPRAPRLADAAFRAQRQAIEQAQLALKKLATQAHGQVLSQLLGAWEQRDPNQVPSARELGSKLNPNERSAWIQALSIGPSADLADTQQALLRLEVAADLPVPAEHLVARRALQLQLLTRRHDPSPEQTWVHDTTTVLASPFEATAGRRLQNALKVLLEKTSSLRR